MATSNKARVRTVLLVLLAGGLGATVLCAGLAGPCWSAWLLDGIVVSTCPAGAVRPVVHLSAEGLGRGDYGAVVVSMDGHYLEIPGGPTYAPVGRLDIDLEVVDPTGKVHPVEQKGGWSDTWHSYDGGSNAQGRRGMFRIPDGPDGDWILRAKVDSPAGLAETELKLPLYVPALAHVATSSPLYKPGQTVQFRGVLLHERDLTPLATRPGTWRVRSPAGEVLLEERGVTSGMGVLASSFPLDAWAEPGTWIVELESGATTAVATVEVREFQLPRFVVEAASERRWWGRGESPVVTGEVRYTSGAPVRDAPVTLRYVGQDGAWPPPNAWKDEVTLTTDARGRFRWALPPVPADLQGKVALQFAMRATEPAGAVATGSVSVLLAEDPVVADAVTELGGGLVPDNNNRLYVRVATPDGVPLRGRAVTLRRQYDPDDPGIVATADADGVALFQLDPERPTTVAKPGLPIRPAPQAEAPRPSLVDAEDRLTGDALSVGERMVADGWTSAVDACRDRVPHGETATVKVAAWIAADGRVRQIAARVGDDEDVLTACVAGALARQAGPRGKDRLWSLDLSLPSTDAPWLTATVDGALGGDDEVEALVDERLRTARGCVAGALHGGELAARWVWSVSRGSAAVSLSPVPTPAEVSMATGADEGCVGRFLAGMTLDDPADQAVLGTLTVDVHVPPSRAQPEPEPITFQGFAYAVSVADASGGAPAETVLRLRAGEIPPLRLRLSEILVDPGDTLELVALRGPNAPTSFPKRLDLMQADRKLLHFDFDPEKRVGSFTVPADARGFLSVTLHDARAVVYVRSPNELAVSVASDRPAYRPGEAAVLTVTTRDGQGPVPAGVLLSGVDQTLGALAPLPGADDFADTVVRATSADPAFGAYDARALQTGQIAGENAAQAAVLRVSSLPPSPPGAVRASGHASSTFDLDGIAQDHFYAFYREVRAAVRAWERTAPEGEVMTPKRMVELWETTLRAHPAVDPFDNPLHLSRVPRDLLVYTDPRVLVSDAARLPEDIEDWAAYVVREAP